MVWFFELLQKLETNFWQKVCLSSLNLKKEEEWNEENDEQDEDFQSEEEDEDDEDEENEKNEENEENKGEQPDSST